MSKLKFSIEQIALAPPDPVRALELLRAMGAEDWSHDHVVALGKVFSACDVTNEADLSFNYTALATARELEVLKYTDGPNWMAVQPYSVSHLGMHCSADELWEWRNFFDARGIPVVQEVLTQSHSNPVIAGKRWYQYVIFDTREILGVDLKFIVRRDTVPD